MALQCEWMLQCYLQHNILSERGGEEKEKEQRGEKCLQDPSDHLSTSQRGRSPLQDFKTLPACLFCHESRPFYAPPVFALSWCEVPNGIPHSSKSGTQSAAVSMFGAERGKSGCAGRICRRQTDETWAEICREEAERKWDACLKAAGSWLQSAGHYHCADYLWSCSLRPKRRRQSSKSLPLCVNLTRSHRNSRKSYCLIVCLCLGANQQLCFSSCSLLLQTN